MRFWHLIIIAILFAIPTLASERYPFPQEQQRQRFVALTEQLRCLVCQNETIAASNAKLATDLRRQVYRMILQQKSDREIKAYLVQRYGDFVLFKPPWVMRTYLLWLLPIVLLFIGMFIVMRVLKGNYRRAA